MGEIQCENSVGILAVNLGLGASMTIIIPPPSSKIFQRVYFLARKFGKKKVKDQLSHENHKTTCFVGPK